MLAHERSGPVGRTPLLLIHAGIADRRMWDPVWPALTAVQDVVRLDLRGYGESTAQPVGPWSPRADVLATLDSLGIGRVHVVGCSFGAGVAVEVALERPEAVASLVLVAPGGALLTERTDELVAFFEAEGNALEAGDLDAAVEANLRAWVDGPRRGPDAVPASVRDKVGAMQRRVFDITGGWPDEVWSAERRTSPPLHRTATARSWCRPWSSPEGSTSKASGRQASTCGPASRPRAPWCGTRWPTSRRWSGR
ncbi:alpha/beta fold hydrolase, partial [Sanguibacter antarcticus]